MVYGTARAGGDAPWRLSQDITIGKVLGNGSFGVVYLGARKVVNSPPEQVAVKLYRRDTNERFCYESHALKSLQHMNIVKYICKGRIDEQCKKNINKSGITDYLVMAYCNGGTLEQKLRKSENYLGLSQRDCLKVVRDISSGIIYMHKENFYHRDIKPANILIDINNQEEVYKLADFDAVKKVELTDETEDVYTSIKGTEIYMYPECLDKIDALKAPNTPLSETALKVDLSPAKIDLYSLGCVMYECATGKLRFYSENKNIVDAARFSKKAPAGALTGFEALSGDISYDDQLPAYSPLSTPYRKQLEVILRGILHKDKTQMWVTDNFKSETEKFNNAHPITFLHLGSGKYRTILLSEEKSCQDVPEASAGADGKVPVYVPLQNGQIGRNTENAQPISVKSLLEWSKFNYRNSKLYFNGKQLEAGQDLSKLQNISRDNPIIIEDHQELSPNKFELKDIKPRPMYGCGDVQTLIERRQLLREQIEKDCGITCFLVREEQGFRQRADLIHKHYEKRVSKLKGKVDEIRKCLTGFMSPGNDSISRRVSELVRALDAIEKDLSLKQALSSDSTGELNKVYMEMVEIKKRFYQAVRSINVDSLDLRSVKKNLAEKNEQAWKLYQKYEQEFNSYVQKMNDFGNHLNLKVNSFLKAKVMKDKLYYKIQGEHQEIKKLMVKTNALMEALDNELKTAKNLELSVNNFPVLFTTEAAIAGRLLLMKCGNYFRTIP